MNRRVYTEFSDFLNQNDLLKTNLPTTQNTAILGEEVLLGKHVAPNRLVCQAMEGCDGTKDGSPDELTKRRYRRFAEGGAGVIWFEATACCAEGRANPRQLYLTEQNLSEFNIIVDCNVVAAFGNPDKIRCVFETSDPMIVVDSAPIAPTDGKFIIPVKFAYGSREEYRQELGNKVHSAVIKCSVAPECEDVVLEGNDEIKVDLSINAQPKAVVRISRK
jgi:hypothetical protein